jgi:ABC-type nickel/cobalt efflux system permease component RcnA
LPVLALVALMARPQPTSAHALGNFTVNRYSRLELYADAVRVRYVLDMAEIPALQEMPSIDTNGDGDVSPSESDAYLRQRASEIADNLTLKLNGSDARVDILATDISFPEGQATLRTLRIGLLLQSPTSGATLSLEYDDANYKDRIGWKEVVLRPAEGVQVSHSTVADVDVSAELTSYPSDLLSTPLDVSSATVSYDASGGARAPANSGSAASGAPAAAPTRAGGGFASLVDTDRLTLPVILVSLLLALGFGAVHALEPGHGKTLLAAYFVGIKGTVRQALGLGLIIAVTHTIGVLAIGVVVLFGSQYVLPERIYPWLSLASGVMILALGIRLIAARTEGWPGVRRFFSVIKGGRGHHHDHDHDPHHGHTHGIDASAPPWKALVALGLADGLTPSPSALIVLLAAVSLDRIGLGLLLIVAFSVGLAAVLTLVCLALLYARRILEWVGSRRVFAARAGYGRWTGLSAGTSALARVAPLGGAIALVAIGLVLTVRALTQPGLPIL